MTASSSASPVISAPEQPWYRPDMAMLREASRQSRLWQAGEVRKRLADVRRNGLTLEELAGLMRSALPRSGGAVRAEILTAAAALRAELFGSWVVPMAPIEVSNTCASDCLFCGWRVSNRAMKRLKVDADLAMLQVEYLVDHGITWIEFVSGDDIVVVRDLLPELITRTRRLLDERGLEGKISFCTMALTEKQYADLKACGADNMIVWQETYDPAVYAEHVVGGPKAHGISDDWKVTRGSDGCGFRIGSQERALRAGLEVAIGAMLGLHPDVVPDFLATIDHARYLDVNFALTREHPLIVGMPVWNKITTPETDLRPDDAPDLNEVFPALAALYLLALPSEGTWVFPNCRVPLGVQVESARAAGAFSSTEVKLGPGGYLPAILRRAEEAGEDTRALRERIVALMREGDPTADPAELGRLLDEREQFMHHHHAHDRYRAAMEEAGLKLTNGVVIPQA